MNGNLRYEKTLFFENCEVEVNRSKTSSYFNVKYKDFVFVFCISDHLSKHRNKMITIISKDRSIKKSKHIAWDMYLNKKNPTHF